MSKFVLAPTMMMTPFSAHWLARSAAARADFSGLAAAMPRLCLRSHAAHNIRLNARRRFLTVAASIFILYKIVGRARDDIRDGKFSTLCDS